MAVLRHEVRLIRADEDVVATRQLVRELAVLLGFNLVDQTKVVTAASELARNVLQHGGGGTVTASALNDDRRRGLRLVFGDRGPGMPDIPLAMKDGYTTVAA
jgi:serine/threonine-protein kinase RsbT